MIRSRPEQGGCGDPACQADQAVCGAFEGFLGFTDRSACVKPVSRTVTSAQIFFLESDLELNTIFLNSFEGTM